MTVAADQMRSRRQRMAAPGGMHDRIVGFLAVVLPAAVGVVAALMIVTPLSPRGEVSFLLDRNKVDVAENRVQVDRAVYRGQDNRNRPFSVMAGEALQRVSTEPVVRMQALLARILLDDGPAVLRAPQGQYNFEEERIVVDGLVRFEAADGYRMAARDVTIDLPTRRMVGSGGIEGVIPAGSFRADRIEADLEARTITLDGNARGRMVPGQLRMP